MLGIDLLNELVVVVIVAVCAVGPLEDKKCACEGTQNKVRVFSLLTILVLAVVLEVELLTISITRFHELVVFISDVGRVEASFGSMVKLLVHLFLL